AAAPSPAAPAEPATARPAPPSVPVKLSDDPRPSYGPETFMATLKAAERYREIAESGGWPSVPNDATRLKSGDRGPVVAALRARLAAEGDLDPSERGGASFDAGLAAALRRFQLRHGLEETGLVGPRTLVQLNVPAAARLRQLQASASRLLGSRFAFGERYVTVNIPSASVEAVEGGSVRRRYVAVVGKPDRASPAVETRVTSINFNPTWTVPVSLIRKDIIPHVRKDPGYLARMKIRLFDGQGREVDPATIDWSTERAVNYTVRQDAGFENSLGEIRIDMPNRHAVYMHDTPSKRLFARDRRAQSSGCVRVSGVKELAGWLLEGTPAAAGGGASWGPMDIETAIAGGKRVDVRLSKPVPVAWVYLTGYAGPDGAAHFRDDIYGLDDPAQAPPAPDGATAKPAPTAARLQPDDLVTSSIRAAAR
ncbi:L,D-transpeptidase family protein, partial [Enterovirga sp.]|uniref:L,D-transpeptidase family protein n=1 Tax=Enterovirga sp. TaxID=2026350 RepID=UPI00261A05CF